MSGKSQIGELKPPHYMYHYTKLVFPRSLELKLPHPINYQSLLMEFYTVLLTYTPILAFSLDKIQIGFNSTFQISICWFSLCITSHGSLFWLTPWPLHYDLQHVIEVILRFPRSYLRLVVTIYVSYFWHCDIETTGLYIHVGYIGFCFN